MISVEIISDDFQVHIRVQWPEYSYLVPSTYSQSCQLLLQVNAKRRIRYYRAKVSRKTKKNADMSSGRGDGADTTFHRTHF